VPSGDDRREDEEDVKERSLLEGHEGGTHKGGGRNVEL
jgi:hypothetical protein